MLTKEENPMYNFNDVIEYYGIIEEDAETVVESATGILKFLKEGRAWNQRNRDGIVDDDFGDRIEFVSEIKNMFENMEIRDEKGLFIMNDRYHINLEPLILFINHNNLRGIVAELEMVGERMLDVLHDTNIFQFREYTKKLNRIRMMFIMIKAEVNS